MAYGWEDLGPAIERLGRNVGAARREEKRERLLEAESIRKRLLEEEDIRKKEEEKERKSTYIGKTLGPEAQREFDLGFGLSERKHFEALRRPGMEKVDRREEDPANPLKYSRKAKEVSALEMWSDKAQKDLGVLMGKAYASSISGSKEEVAAAQEAFKSRAEAIEKTSQILKLENDKIKNSYVASLYEDLEPTLSAMDPSKYKLVTESLKSTLQQYKVIHPEILNTLEQTELEGFPSPKRLEIAIQKGFISGEISSSDISKLLAVKDIKKLGEVTHSDEVPKSVRLLAGALAKMLIFAKSQDSKQSGATGEF